MVSGLGMCILIVVAVGLMYPVVQSNKPTYMFRGGRYSQDCPVY